MFDHVSAQFLQPHQPPPRHGTQPHRYRHPKGPTRVIARPWGPSSYPGHTRTACAWSESAALGARASRWVSLSGLAIEWTWVMRSSATTNVDTPRSRPSSSMAREGWPLTQTTSTTSAPSDFARDHVGCEEETGRSRQALAARVRTGRAPGRTWNSSSRCSPTASPSSWTAVGCRADTRKPVDWWRSRCS